MSRTAISNDEIRCEEVLRQLFAYLDQELEPETSGRIAHHLQLCRACFSRAEFERRLKAHLQQCAIAPAPAGLRRRLKLMIDRF